MWQRFTEYSRRVILLAQEEAALMRSGYVGTEHLVVGLMQETRGGAAHILQIKGVTLEGIRQELEGIKKLDATVNDNPVEPRLTARTKRVLELAADEARKMRLGYIGTEHLLLAVLREKDGEGAAILRRLGLNLEATRQKVNEHKSPDFTDGTPETAAVPVIEKASNITERINTRMQLLKAASQTQTISDFVFAPEVMLLLTQAAIEAKAESETLLSSRHLLQAIVENPDSGIAAQLQALGLDLEKVRTFLNEPKQPQ